MVKRMIKRALAFLFTKKPIIYLPDNLYHQVDGPSFIRRDGTKVWYWRGRHHRIDGPAIIYPDGKVKWWVNGRRIRSSDEFQKVTGISNEELSVLILKYGEIK